MIYEISRQILALFFRLKFRYTLEFIGGKDAVFPKKQAFILAANHISYLDPPAVGAGCPRHLAYLAKQELFENKILAWWMRQVGCIALNRQSGDVGALKQALRVLKSGKPMIMFPQGTRSQDLDQFKSGIGFLVKKTQVPVIAARVYGTDQILPKDAKKMQPGKIKVVYKRVDSILQSDDYHQIAAKIVETIKSL